MVKLLNFPVVFRDEKVNADALPVLNHFLKNSPLFYIELKKIRGGAFPARLPE
jgi:hypothetical protein